MTSYTHPLTTEQAARLRALLKELNYEFAERPYTLFFAQKNKLSVAVYEKGPKILLQGKGIEEFVQFELEPKILGEAKLGYEEVHSPEMFEPHFGIDESGKGDFFGHLVIAGVYVDHEIARKFLDAGIQDSKRIGSDKRIRDLAKIIRTTPGAVGEIQITDAMRSLLRKRPFYAVRFEGTRYDAGDKLGFLIATVEFALKHEELAPEFREYLQSLKLS